jgi:hypothetical protein
MDMTADPKNHDKLDWDALSTNPAVSLDFMLDRYQMPWNWNLVSTNPGITWSDVRGEGYIQWNYRKLAKHIPWNIIREWVSDMDASMMCNPSITWELACSHGMENAFSGNPNVTWDLVSSNPDVDWDFWRLSSNPGIKLGDVVGNPRHPWDMRELARNPSLNWDRDLIGRGFANPNGYMWSEVYLSTNPSLDWNGVKLTAAAYANMSVKGSRFPWYPMMLLENPCIFGQKAGI